MGGGGGIVGGVTRGLEGAATFGTSEIGRAAVNNPGTAARIGAGAMTFGTSELAMNALGGFGGGGGPNVPTVGGQQTPLQILQSTGGAPLLTDIALGADTNSSIMSYFGASGDYNNWVNSLDDQDKQAVQSLSNQLNQIQSTTNKRQAAVSQLATDFPNIMAQKIPQYSAIADSVTQQMMNLAINQIAAKQAAGGMMSSGATQQAAAEAGAQIGMQKLQYGTNLSIHDYENQFNTANALNNFQQKMMGQAAGQGASAIQYALNRNAQISGQQANIQWGANQQNYQQQQGLYGALGGLVGAGLGAVFSGPAGASVGSSLGSSLSGRGTGGYTAPPSLGGMSGYGLGYGFGSPRLNAGGM